MLNTVLELSQNRIRNITRALGYEVDADTLGTDETDDLVDLLDKEGRCIVKEQVRFIKEEYDLRLIEIANLRQILVELAHEPQEECRVEKRLVKELCRIENIDHSASGGIGLQEVQNIESRLGEERLGTLVSKKRDASLDRADRRGGDVTIGKFVFVSVVTDVGEQETEVLKVKDQESLIISDAEDHGHNRALYIGKTQHTAEKDRTELGDRGSHRDAHRSENIVERGRICLVLEVLDAELRDTLFHAVVAYTCCADTGHIALDVCEEYRNAHVGETLGEDLQRDRLACTGRAGDQTMTVRFRRLDEALRSGPAYPNFVVV